MSNEKAVEYDYESSLSYIGSLQTFCGLMTGFALTSMTLVVTMLEDPTTLLAQTVIFTLCTMMIVFIVAFNEMTFMKTLTCLDSPKPIIPIYPVRWLIANTCMIGGTLIGALCLLVMLLLMNLTLLFVLETSIQVLAWIWFFYRWKPVYETWKAKWKSSYNPSKR